MVEESKEDDVLEVPFVPPDVGTTSQSPGVEGQEPPPFTTAQPVTDATERGVADDEGFVPEFDPKHRTAFEGLLYLGKLQKTFEWAGHKFVIRTITVDSQIEAGQLHKDYVNTIADVKAWQSLIAAACVISVDGQALPIPMSDEVGELQNKFNYIIQHWYPWTLDKIYEQYLILDQQVEDVILAMGKV